jgi:hypothetical protein
MSSISIHAIQASAQPAALPKEETARCGYIKDVAQAHFERCVMSQGAASDSIPIAVQMHFAIIEGDTPVSTQEANQCSAYFNSIMAKVRPEPVNQNMPSYTVMAELHNHPAAQAQAVEAAIAQLPKLTINDNDKVLPCCFNRFVYLTPATPSVVDIQIVVGKYKVAIANYSWGCPKCKY